MIGLIWNEKYGIDSILYGQHADIMINLMIWFKPRVRVSVSKYHQMAIKMEWNEIMMKIKMNSIQHSSSNQQQNKSKQNKSKWNKMKSKWSLLKWNQINNEIEIEMTDQDWNEITTWNQSEYEHEIKVNMSMKWALN